MRTSPKKPAEDRKIPLPIAVALAVSAVSLASAIGTARWCWLLLDEQIRLREGLTRLESKQEQVEIQYEFWLRELQSVRQADETAK